MSWNLLQSLRKAPRAERNNPKIPRTRHDTTRGYAVTQRGSVTYAIDDAVDNSLRFRLDETQHTYQSALQSENNNKIREADERQQAAKDRFKKSVRGGIILKPPSTTATCESANSNRRKAEGDEKAEGSREIDLLIAAQSGDLLSLAEIACLMEKKYVSNVSIIESLAASNREAELRLELLEKQLHESALK